MSKVQASPAKNTKPIPAAAPAKVEKVAEPVIEYVTSTELATRLGTKGTILRRWLRTLPQFQDAGYTRYKWEPTDQFLKDAADGFAKYQKSDDEKKAARLEEARKKSEAKKAAADAGETAPKGKKGKKAATPEPADTDDSGDDADFEDDAEGEDLE
jgi:plasmid replication initiation protein